MDVGATTPSEFAHTIFKGNTEGLNSDRDKSSYIEKVSPYAAIAPQLRNQKTLTGSKFVQMCQRSKSNHRPVGRENLMARTERDQQKRVQINKVYGASVRPANQADEEDNFADQMAHFESVAKSHKNIDGRSPDGMSFYDENRA